MASARGDQGLDVRSVRRPSGWEGSDRRARDCYLVPPGPRRRRSFPRTSPRTDLRSPVRCGLAALLLMRPVCGRADRRAAPAATLPDVASRSSLRPRPPPPLDARGRHLRRHGSAPERVVRAEAAIDYILALMRADGLRTSAPPSLFPLYPRDGIYARRPGWRTPLQILASASASSRRSSGPRSSCVVVRRHDCARRRGAGDRPLSLPFPTSLDGPLTDWRVRAAARVGPWRPRAPCHALSLTHAPLDDLYASLRGRACVSRVPTASVTV